MAMCFQDANSKDPDVSTAIAAVPHLVQASNEPCCCWADCAMATASCSYP
jgi:hypothetical protein